MNGTPVVKQLREHIDKWDYMKQKCFWTAKEIVTSHQTEETACRMGGKSLLAIHLTRD
jgi:hypothetical protein